jgi:putative ABC transport system permease protein
MDKRDFERLTGDRRANELQLWLAPGADAAQVQDSMRGLAQRVSGSADVIEISSAQQLRAISLRIFDRSFAVTYWLQAVAIGIGLFGIAASFSAQVLARRKEFGLLAHLGLTRAQILAVVAGEGAAWTAIGSIAGLGLGLAVSVILVHVVNPQSFHWTMDLLVPWARLLTLCAAVVAAGTVTAWLAGRAAAGRDAVLAVKEDW